jgi:hypothetical protein
MKSFADAMHLCKPTHHFYQGLTMRELHTQELMAVSGGDSTEGPSLLGPIMIAVGISNFLGGSFLGGIAMTAGGIYLTDLALGGGIKKS